MKKLFLLALPMALAAVSCSNEEVVSVNNDANEIKFAVTAENATRAQNVFCNVNLPKEFHVWAAVGGKQYFEKVQYKQNGDKYTAEGGKVHFWPAEAVDFYAVTEENTGTPTTYYDWAATTDASLHKFNWNAAGSSTITWETRSNEAPTQTDLLYAYTKQSRPEGTAGVVGINFRHALSQIVFKALNTNPTIKVEIDQVEIVNVTNKGTFTMPTGVTDTPYEDHTTAGTYVTTGVGSWGSYGTFNQTYTTTKFDDAVTVAYDGRPTPVAVNLTDEVGVNESGNQGEEGYVAASHPLVKHSLLLIPQTTTKWARTEADKKDPDAEGQTGSYFKVWCKIWNVSGVDGGAGADLLLWGTDANTTKPVYIPIGAAWEPGKKYIYTFKFGSNTTGGYDDKGDPVLIPISFTVSVDDFAEVTETGVPMD